MPDVRAFGLRACAYWRDAVEAAAALQRGTAPAKMLLTDQEYQRIAADLRRELAGLANRSN
jgi:hypothetical protein